MGEKKNSVCSAWKLRTARGVQHWGAGDGKKRLGGGGGVLRGGRYYKGPHRGGFLEAGPLESISCTIKRTDTLGNKMM